MTPAQVANAERLADAIGSTNHKYLIANLYFVRVADGRGRNTSRYFFELQQRHIRLNVRADHAGDDLLAVRKLDARNIRGLHYVRCC